MEYKKDRITCMVGDYEVTISPKIGSGSFGQVYESRRKNSQLLFAVKQVELTLDGKLNDRLRRRTETELNVIRHLQDHNNIVKLHDVVMLESSCWMFMEYCTLRNLKCYLKDNERLGLAAKIQIMQQCASAIAFMHSQTPKIVHRDIKLENVLMTEFENEHIAKISDFGLSKLQEEHSSKQSALKTFAGTKHYMAPEQFARTQYDTKVDVFALGLVFCVIFEFGPEHQLTIPLSESARKRARVKLHSVGEEMLMCHKSGKELPVVVRPSNDDSSCVRSLKDIIQNMTQFRSRDRKDTEEIENDLKELTLKLTVADNIESVVHGVSEKSSKPKVITQSTGEKSNGKSTSSSSDVMEYFNPSYDRSKSCNSFSGYRQISLDSPRSGQDISNRQDAKNEGKLTDLLKLKYEEFILETKGKTSDAIIATDLIEELKIIFVYVDETKEREGSEFVEKYLKQCSELAEIKKHPIKRPVKIAPHCEICEKTVCICVDYFGPGSPIVAVHHSVWRDVREKISIGKIQDLRSLSKYLKCARALVDGAAANTLPVFCGPWSLGGKLVLHTPFGTQDVYVTSCHSLGEGRRVASKEKISFSCSVEPYLFLTDIKQGGKDTLQVVSEKHWGIYDDKEGVDILILQVFENPHIVYTSTPMTTMSGRMCHVGFKIYEGIQEEFIGKSVTKRGYKTDWTRGRIVRFSAKMNAGNALMCSNYFAVRSDTPQRLEFANVGDSGSFVLESIYEPGITLTYGIVSEVIDGIYCRETGQHENLVLCVYLCKSITTICKELFGGEAKICFEEPTSAMSDCSVTSAMESFDSDVEAVSFDQSESQDDTAYRPGRSARGQLSAISPSSTHASTNDPHSDMQETNIQETSMGQITSRDSGRGSTEYASQSGSNDC